jgi:hypothetical protein
LSDTLRAIFSAPYGVVLLGEIPADVEAACSGLAPVPADARMADGESYDLDEPFKAGGWSKARASSRPASAQEKQDGLPVQRRPSKRITRVGLLADEHRPEGGAEGEQSAAASRRPSKTFNLEAQAVLARRDSKSIMEARLSQRFYTGEHDPLNVDLQSTSVEAGERPDDGGDDTVEVTS